MKVTWNWLAEFVDLTLPIERLAERLTLAGLEVEAVEAWGRGVDDVVCAEVVRVTPHPAAERLSVCELRTGRAGATVVCGATNVHAGDRVAYAPPGARLPDGRRLATEEVRGVRSAGMLCAAAEIGLGGDASGILVLPTDAALGERVAAVLGIADTVLDVAVTPNRGDCLSVLGLAREIAALTGQRLLRQRAGIKEGDASAAELVAIRIADPDLCGRYVGRIVLDVTIQPAPLWMQSRLQAVGLRPINNVVDVTNYVMIERGQPLHAFDYDRLPQREIVVRRAGKDGVFTTLDGRERPLAADDLVISSGSHPVAIAGVMGGADTEVSAATRRILLESAWFSPASVRRTARRLDLHSEAAYRFERGTDIEAAAAAADRAAALIARLAGGTVARGRIDAYPGTRPAVPITVRLKRIGELLGVNVGRAEVITRLKALGLTVSPAARGTLSVQVPAYRADLDREVDVIEEIARVGGYEHIPATLPQSVLGGAGMPADVHQQRTLKRILIAQGLHEAVLVAFCAAASNATFPELRRRPPVRILNPFSEEDGELRSSLCAGLVRALRGNLDQDAAAVGLFSFGKVFWRDDGFGEAWRVAGVLSGALPNAGLGARGAPTEFVDLKGVVETVMDCVGAAPVRWLPLADWPSLHPGQSARLQDPSGETIGVAGRLHPAVQDELKLPEPCWLFELDFGKLLEYRPLRVVYRELPRFPSVARDLAVVAEEGFAADEVVRFVREWSKTSQLIEDVYLFDQYTGPPVPPGKKSLAYSIAYRAGDRTLTDVEVNDLHGTLVAAVHAALPVEPRQ